MAYYGVRYAKNCDPSDLWKSYRTSSKHVTNFVNKHGNPDVISIRKTFGEDTDSAREWENKVIRRCRMVEDKGYLNHTNNIAIPVTNHDRVKNLQGARTFPDWDIETQEKERERRRNQWENHSPEKRERLRREASERAKKQHAEGRFNGYEKPDDTTNYKNAANKRWSDPSFKKKMKSKKWMNLNEKSKMISPEDLESYLSMGWSFGRGG